MVEICYNKSSLFSSVGRAFDCSCCHLLSNCHWFDSGNREFSINPPLKYFLDIIYLKNKNYYLLI